MSILGFFVFLLTTHSKQLSRRFGAPIRLVSSVRDIEFDSGFLTTGYTDDHG